MLELADDDDDAGTLSSSLRDRLSTDGGVVTICPLAGCAA